MNKKSIPIPTNDYLIHGGPGSGRYPLGSGERPYQHKGNSSGRHRMRKLTTQELEDLDWLELALDPKVTKMKIGRFNNVQVISNHLKKTDKETRKEAETIYKASYIGAMKEVKRIEQYYKNSGNGDLLNKDKSYNVQLDYVNLDYNLDGSFREPSAQYYSPRLGASIIAHYDPKIKRVKRYEYSR